MDLRFGIFVVIFLIVAFIWQPTDGKNSGTPSLPNIPTKIGPTKTKSELKCDEYVRELVGTTEITSLVGTSPDVIKVDNVCRDANRLVVGGTEARPGEFPHMVALGRRNSDETFTLICGATLISHTWVLSAAHCTYGPNGSPTDARIGFHRLTDQQPGVTIAIKNMIRHPDYNPPAMYADIALVQLMNAVTFSTSIRPACLYVQYDNAPMNAWISGWGVTEFAGEQTDRLQKAQLDLIDNLACTIRHNSSKEVPYGVTPSMVCAGDPRGGWTKDSCQGDSGGPLQIIHPKNLCFFQVIGITSFGQGCAIIDTPGVYTRVSHYISYIENIVWP
ncbi:serine protease snake-like isoform X1 [Cataglyphis hispanica]|uniref:serine protease snake-like isoform X1 n=1 Tax=Cataglyphis hispanica TaxID=1086592 RepID=UPI0021802E6E|nr:serine protease snake-like isoform X1 [Cataglyphis hispanica]